MTPTPAEISWYTSRLLNRCHSCYEKLDSVKTVVTDRIDYTVLEEKILCGHCGVQADYCAHGNWEGVHYMQQFEKENPKIAELLQKMVGK